MLTKLGLAFACLAAALGIAACGSDDTVGGAREGEVQVAESGPVPAGGQHAALPRSAAVGEQLVTTGGVHVSQAIAGSAACPLSRRAIRRRPALPGEAGVGGKPCPLPK